MATRVLPMIHALIWLPLLALFIYLAWAGWDEYQKVQAYGVWAATFEDAKYDILAVLGRRGDRLSWGRPTRKGPTDLREIDLERIAAVHLYVDGQIADPAAPPTRGQRIELRLVPIDGDTLAIPFTETGLAARWCKLLQRVVPC